MDRFYNIIPKFNIPCYSVACAYWWNTCPHYYCLSKNRDLDSLGHMEKSTSSL